MSDLSFDVDLGSTGVKVELIDERDSDPLSPGLVADLCKAARVTLEGEGVETGSVDILVVDEATIARLNSTHLGHDGPTDVLSFPLDDPSEGSSFGFRPHVGDIVLCPAIAKTQAADHAGSLEAELHLLVIHAALHLLGHDHSIDADRKRMQDRERAYLAGFGFEHPGEQS